MKKFLVTLCALTLCACASASNPGAMVPEVTESTIISNDSALRENVSVGNIGGGRETNPMWTSQVSDEDFAEALRQTFAAHAMLATDAGDYRLDAELVELNQPFAGLDMTVSSTVQYTLTDTNSGEVLLDELVAYSYTAEFGDAFMGVERLRLANEGSIKSNIGSMISLMIEAVGEAEMASSAGDNVAP